jgi:hypothetical protein
MLAGNLSLGTGEDDEGVVIETNSDSKHEILPEAAAFLGLAVALAPENESYRESYERYVGKN